MLPESLVSYCGTMAWIESVRLSVLYWPSPLTEMMGLTSITPGVLAIRLTSRSVSFAGAFCTVALGGPFMLMDMGSTAIVSSSRLPNCWLTPACRPSPRVSMTTMAITPMMMPSEDIMVLNLLLVKSENAYSSMSNDFTA